MRILLNIICLATALTSTLAFAGRTECFVDGSSGPFHSFTISEKDGIYSIELTKSGNLGDILFTGDPRDLDPWSSFYLKNHDKVDIKRGADTVSNNSLMFFRFSSTATFWYWKSEGFNKGVWLPTDYAQSIVKFYPDYFDPMKIHFEIHLYSKEKNGKMVARSSAEAIFKHDDCKFTP